MSVVCLTRFTRGWLGLVTALLLTPLGTWSAEPAAPRRFAILVGVKDYDHRNLLRLQYPENDVAELGSLLRAAGFEVVLLTGSDGARDKDVKPTRANIERHLKTALDKAGKSDLVLLALAGHGLHFDKVEDSFFCPQDAIPLDDADSRKTLLSLKSVYRQMEASRAGVKLLIVDACRNDPKGAEPGDWTGPPICDRRKGWPLCSAVRRESKPLNTTTTGTASSSTICWRDCVARRAIARATSPGIFCKATCASRCPRTCRSCLPPGKRPASTPGSCVASRRCWCREV